MEREREAKVRKKIMSRNETKATRADAMLQEFFTIMMRARSFCSYDTLSRDVAPSSLIERSSCGTASVVRRAQNVATIYIVRYHCVMQHPKTTDILGVVKKISEVYLFSYPNLCKILRDNYRNARASIPGVKTLINAVLRTTNCLGRQ